MDDIEWSKLVAQGWRLSQLISTKNPSIKHGELFEAIEAEAEDPRVRSMAFAFLLTYVKNAKEVLVNPPVEEDRRPQMGEEVKRVITRVSSKSRKGRAASGR